MSNITKNKITRKTEWLLRRYQGLSITSASRQILNKSKYLKWPIQEKEYSGKIISLESVVNIRKISKKFQRRKMAGKIISLESALNIRKTSKSFQREKRREKIISLGSTYILSESHSSHCCSSSSNCVSHHRNHSRHHHHHSSSSSSSSKKVPTERIEHASRQSRVVKERSVGFLRQTRQPFFCCSSSTKLSIHHHSSSSSSKKKAPTE